MQSTMHPYPKRPCGTSVACSVYCMCRLQEQAREEVWKRPSSARSDMPAPDGKPWQATTYTTYLSEEEEVGIRKRPAVVT